MSSKQSAELLSNSCSRHSKAPRSRLKTDKHEVCTGYQQVKSAPVSPFALNRQPCMQRRSPQGTEISFNTCSALTQNLSVSVCSAPFTIKDALLNYYQTPIRSVGGSKEVDLDKDSADVSQCDSNTVCKRCSSQRKLSETWLHLSGQ